MDYSTFNTYETVHVTKCDTLLHVILNYICLYTHTHTHTHTSTQHLWNLLPQTRRFP